MSVLERRNVCIGKMSTFDGYHYPNLVRPVFRINKTSIKGTVSPCVVTGEDQDGIR